jgi:hypothetical protein
MVQKGRISAVEPAPVDAQGNETTARVIPATGDGIVTRPLIIPSRLRGLGGSLAPNVEVIFIVFEDCTGFIIDRADGEFFGEIYGDVTIHGSVNARGNVEARGNISAGADMSLGGDLHTGAVTSYNNHRHPYTWTFDGGSGVTSPPE